MTAKDAARGARTQLAVVATRAINLASRRIGAGRGSVAGGHVGLLVDPRLLEHLAAGRRLALVSGTNGKTTTTRLLAVAIEGRLGAAATNATGSNMPTGHVTALAGAQPGAPAVLEVDESYIPQLVASLSPEVVVLLNLSRDQLDRTNEVRMVANRWQRALAAAPGTTVVANADDPLVAWAARDAARAVWVGAGLSWRADAVGCPACDGRIVFSASSSGGWGCTCGFARPPLDLWLEDPTGAGGGTTVVVFADGRRLPLELRLPGRFNRANAAVAAAAAEAFGIPADEALAVMGTVDEVAGRFATTEIAGVAVRLMLAKNPAGWRELLDLVCPGDGPVVVGINARIADGRDPSWLWDVPFERLRGRPVIATGERYLDLSVRLRYAEVPHLAQGDPIEAVRVAGEKIGGARGERQSRAHSQGSHAVDYIGNYTAFYDLLARSGARPTAGGRGARRPSSPGALEETSR